MAQKNNFFTDSESFRTIDTKRIVYLITAIAAFLTTEFGRFVYRPFIYEHNIQDLGLADSVGNWGGIIVQVFFGLVFLNPPFKKGFRLIAFFVAGYIVYEILQPVLPKGTFDWLDIYGTLVGGTLASLIYILIPQFIKHNKVFLSFNTKK